MLRLDAVVRVLKTTVKAFDQRCITTSLRGRHRKTRLGREKRDFWERERDCVDRRRADIHKGGREGVEGGEEKSLWTLSLAAIEIGYSGRQLPRDPASREAWRHFSYEGSEPCLVLALPEKLQCENETWFIELSTAMREGERRG